MSQATIANEAASACEHAAVGPTLVKIGGRLLEDEAALDRAMCVIITMRDVADVVLVHGGGAAVDRHMARCGLEIERRDGIRLTPPSHVEEIVAVLAGRVNKSLVGRVQAMGAPAVGLCLADGALARTVADDRLPFDAGRVGRIEDGDPTLVKILHRGGYLPIVCSVGFDDRGEALNVNADDALAGLARILDATRIIMLTDVAGVLNAEGRVVRELTSDDAQRLITDGVVRGGMIPKVRSAVTAAQRAGIDVMIAGWQDEVALQAIACGETAGTVVRPSGVTR